MATLIERAARQTRRYQFEDGFLELTLGFAFALIGSLLLADQSALVPWVMIFAIIPGRQAIHWLRTRFTYPRTGYVEYPEPSRRRSVASAVAGFVLAAAAGWAVIQIPDLRQEFAAIQGILIAAVLLWAGRRTGLVRLLVLAAVSAALGVIATVAIGGIAGWAVYFVAMGAVLGLSGALALRTYLHSSPPPASA